MLNKINKSNISNQSKVFNNENDVNYTEKENKKIDNEKEYSDKNLSSLRDNQEN